MRIKICVAVACLASALIGTTRPAQAAPVSWSIVSSASTISLAIPNQTLTITSTSSIVSGVLGTSLTVSLRALNPGTGTDSIPTGWTIGNSQNVTGVLQTNTDFQSYIKFLDALPSTDPTIITGIDSGSYAPRSNGSAGSTSADFGSHIYAGAGITLGGLNLDLAFRNARYLLNSDVVATSGVLNNHTFEASDTNFGMGANVAYRSRNGFGLGGSAFVGLLGSGAQTLNAIATDNTGGTGSIVVTPQVGGDLATLTIPIVQTLNILLDNENLAVVKLNVTGTIVATAIVPEPATFGLLAFGVAMLAPFAVRRWRMRE